MTIAPANDERRAAERRALVPPLRYPAELPVTARHDDLLDAITNHQVVIVAGETGSGKSTQLPKLCLEAGRGLHGFIGHTQPRRLAARAVAERVAEELGSEVGGIVGYAVRFTDKVSDTTLVKVMTDGILLAEIQRDRLLRRYDTIIIDEAHERSLNIDFLLGYLRWLHAQRPDLKIIITSATIDTERFSAHFDGAPVVEVSGRAYPVELRYRPLTPDADDPQTRPATDRDQTQAVCDAVDELCAEGPGDILVFLSGEREIRDTADALREQERPDTEILPLYARLSMADQHRVFASHRGRRVVLATNVAETSLTVPGVRYVVDTGTARISRYNRRTKVQRLPIEAISQASANQRAGRCGRLGPGVCIRLYSEDDFRSRPEFTEAEILRTNLASVILQMAALRLGDVATFPFVDPPERRSINDGIAVLEELGALDPGVDPHQPDGKAWLTPLGRRLARLPVDPRLGRMILEADRLGCVREVTIIAAALSIQDPRERPTGKEQAAAEHHRRFVHPDSDLLSYLLLWSYLGDRRHELSSSGFRRMCRNEYLNYLRVREWQDLVSQLRRVTNQLHVKTNHDDASPDDVHRALLSGLLSQIGLRDPERGDYLGARGARFMIAPGSGLKRSSPRWIMAAELVETNRLWARRVARIQPGWVERLGSHLLTYHYSDPQWSSERAGTVALERVTLHGLPLVTGRRVDFGRIDPTHARFTFIRHALIERDWVAHHAFLTHNVKVVAQLHEFENRLRLTLEPDDEVLFHFYDRVLPPQITSGRHFDHWWKKTRPQSPELLNLSLHVLLADHRLAEGTVADAYPDDWAVGDIQLPLRYRYDPGTATDGITVTIPIGVLNRLDPDEFDWLVPGMRPELVSTVLRQLPKQLRKLFVPIPESVAGVLGVLDPASGRFGEQLTRRLSQLAGTPIPHGMIEQVELPDHLRMRFEVTDGSGAVLAAGRDLAALQTTLAPRVRATLRRAAADFECGGQRSWTFGTIPRLLEPSGGGSAGWSGPALGALRGYPALRDEGDGVGLRVTATGDEQHHTHWDGIRRLLRLTTASPLRALRPIMTNEVKLAAARNGVELREFIEDCLVACFDHLLDEAGGPVWDEASFDALRRRVGAAITEVTVAVADRGATTLRRGAALRSQLDGLSNPKLSAAQADLNAQLDDLVFPGFVTAAGVGRLADIDRYLQGMQRRLDKAAKDPTGDARRMMALRTLEADFDEIASRWPAGGHPPQVQRARWLLEELRVATFAQVLGTAEPVSETKVRAVLSQLRELA